MVDNEYQQRWRVRPARASRAALIQYAQEDARRIEWLIYNRDNIDKAVRDAAKQLGWEASWVDKCDTLSLVFDLRDYAVALREQYIDVRTDQGVPLDRATREADFDLLDEERESPND